MTKLAPPMSQIDAQAQLPSIRLFLPGPLGDQATVTTTAAQAHYLAHVMRRGVGDRLRVFNGSDGEFVATISDLRRDHAALAIGEQSRPQPREPDLWLIFALLKRGPTELIVQKATELGASALLPAFTTRTNADRTNLDRLTAIATEAAEQCGRLTVPTLRPPRALSAILADWPAGRRLIACFERAADLPMPRSNNEPSALLIGPEGGFTDTELDALQARPFVLPVTLGPRLLRAETAAIVGLALLQLA